MGKVAVPPVTTRSVVQPVRPVPLEGRNAGMLGWTLRGDSLSMSRRGQPQRDYARHRQKEPWHGDPGTPPFQEVDVLRQSATRSGAVRLRDLRIRDRWCGSAGLLAGVRAGPAPSFFGQTPRRKEGLWRIDVAPRASASNGETPDRRSVLARSRSMPSWLAVSAAHQDHVTANVVAHRLRLPRSVIEGRLARARASALLCGERLLHTGGRPYVPEPFHDRNE